MFRDLNIVELLVRVIGVKIKKSSHFVLNCEIKCSVPLIYSVNNNYSAFLLYHYFPTSCAIKQLIGEKKACAFVLVISLIRLCSTFRTDFLVTPIVSSFSSARSS